MTQRPAVRITDASLRFGERSLWSRLTLAVRPGEFVAVLGPNGSGKTSLLRVLLGQQRLGGGTAEVDGGAAAVGYVPQQGASEAGAAAAVRGVDLVGLGLDGGRWGLGLRGMKERRRRVAAAVAAVDGQEFAGKPFGQLSGGEQQRLRVAQALVGEPSLLLCDEPLLSLDLAHQQAVSGLIDRRRREADTAVLFVTHELNPILSYVDRVVYLVDGRFRIGKPHEVMTSEVLSDLYRTQVRVVRLDGQIH
ncbi:MAG: metal ABC transporter ATP-binding protein, partial [Thermocrispum sp.]